MLAEAGPTAIPVAVMAVAVLGACTALVVLMARHAGPGPAEVAVAYEHAWDRLDFVTLWNLSSPHLRDGRSRNAFVRDKQAAYAGQRQRDLSRLVRAVRPAQVDVNGPVARVLTQLDLADGQHLTDEMLLERIGSTWQVTAYSLVPPKPA